MAVCALCRRVRNGWPKRLRTLQEQLSLQAMQIKKKDARIAYFEKNRNRK